MSTPTKIMRELRDQRRRRGIRLSDLQQAVGYHRTAIGNWERGKYSPTLVALDDLCQAIGLRLTVHIDEQEARAALEPKP
jgi:transcriptional regulator with XRE-family HTH domain